MPSPDDICAVCGETRENHGDKNHIFDMDNPVPRKLKPAEPPRKPAPESITQEMKAAAFTGLLEVLTEKGILDAKDLLRILA